MFYVRYCNETNSLGDFSIEVNLHTLNDAIIKFESVFPQAITFWFMPYWKIIQCYRTLALAIGNLLFPLFTYLSIPLTFAIWSVVAFKTFDFAIRMFQQR